MVVLLTVKRAKGGGDHVSGCRTFRLSPLHESRHIHAGFCSRSFCHTVRVCRLRLFFSATPYACFVCGGFLSQHTRARSQVFTAWVVLGSLGRVVDSAAIPLSRRLRKKIQREARAQQGQYSRMASRGQDDHA